MCVKIETGERRPRGGKTGVKECRKKTKEHM